MPGTIQSASVKLLFLMLQRLVADVFSAPRARPANLLHGGVGLQFGVADGIADRGDAQDASTIIDDFAFV